MSAPSVPIPFTVIGGYLGAGKTTLLNRLLHSTSERLAVLVNDFGEIDIDSSLIDSHHGETISLSNGCVCCSLADGFFAALQTVRAIEPPIDRVIVEASGVAEPLSVAQWGHTPGFQLDAVVVVVDAETIIERANDPLLGDTVRRQVRGADLVLLTKTDLVDDDGTARDWIGAYSDAPILESRFGRVSLELIIGGAVQSLSTPVPNEGVHAHHVTASLDFDGLIDDEAFRLALDRMPSDLLRAKGVVRLRSSPDRRTVLHIVGRRHSVTTRDAWIEGENARIVAIGRPTTSVEAIKEWLGGFRVP
jgi:G3E family GTPase